MKYLIANPHNGSPVNANGIELNPGYQLEVKQSDALELKKTFDFLLYREVKGNPSPATAKPKKLSKRLEWSSVTHDDPDVPDFAVHAEAPTAKVKKAKK
jgi:hypothetical protein